MKSEKKYQKKMDILCSIRSLPKITKKEFKQLLIFSKDEESLIRGHVAEIISEKEIRNHASIKLLMRLAYDKDYLVRTDAFDIPEVELFFRQAIHMEKNKIACWYAVRGWIKIALSIHDDYSDDINYVKWLLRQRKIQESEHCLLECYYSLYRFGEADILPTILSFAESKDYHMHYVVFYILQEIVNEENRAEIIEAIQKILENTYAMGFVKTALPFWKELIVEHTYAIMKREAARQSNNKEAEK